MDAIHYHCTKVLFPFVLMARLVNATQETPQVGTIGDDIKTGLRLTIYCDVGECHHATPSTWRR
jgi:hypothetical protein